MKITLVGMGSGLPGSLTAQGLQALQTAGLILGGKAAAAKPAGWLYPPTVSQFTCRMKCWPACKRSLARPPRWFTAGIPAFIPVLRRWCPSCGHRGGSNGAAGDFQRTAVGRGAGQAVAELAPCQRPRMYLRPCGRVPERPPDLFFLTGGRNTSPAALCEILAAAGFGAVQATVGENLGTLQQKVITDTVQTLAGGSFAPLSVLLVEPCPKPQPRVPGLPDEAFIRGKTPMTKQEVRAAALAKLAVAPTDTLWDVGAGTGSVSVEMALAAPWVRCTRWNVMPMPARWFARTRPNLPPVT